MKYFVNISLNDWLIVLFFGLTFGGILGAFISGLIGFIGFFQGFLSGMVFGFSIFVYSFILINLSNKYILPKISERFWEPVSLFFSFLAGLLGSITGYYAVLHLDLIHISLSKKVLYSGFLLVGLLTALIANLLYKTVNLRKVEAELQKSLIMSKLKALEYQVNPHFLFNTLNTILELIHINPSLAERAVISLSKYLREIINEESLISIEKELEIVKHYIFIQKLRFPNINFHFDVDDSVLSVSIPKLSVQILVENAIIHGVKSKGNVWIEAKRLNNKVVIKVIDDGENFQGIKEGVGLSNLRTRLKLILNGDLRYYREDNKTVFTIEIPVSVKK